MDRCSYALRRHCRSLPLRREQRVESGFEEIEASITPRTRALVLINPNNPTGAVYSEETVRGLADIARRHELVLLSDEIYEKIIFDDAVHHHTATSAGDDVLCLDLSGLLQGFTEPVGTALLR